MRGILPILLIGAVALGAYFFWNPTICQPLTNITGGAFNFCYPFSSHHDFTQRRRHQGLLHLEAGRASGHFPAPQSIKHTNTKHPDTLPSPVHAPAAGNIGFGGGAAAILGSNASTAHLAELSHHRMSIY